MPVGNSCRSGKGVWLSCVVRMCVQVARGYRSASINVALGRHQTFYHYSLTKQCCEVTTDRGEP